MFPLASYAGVGQASPPVEVIAVISFAVLCVRCWWMPSETIRKNCVQLPVSSIALYASGALNTFLQIVQTLNGVR
jgi:hypothetical protein